MRTKQRARLGVVRQRGADGWILIEQIGKPGHVLVALARATGNKPRRTGAGQAMMVTRLARAHLRMVANRAAVLGDRACTSSLVVAGCLVVVLYVAASIFIVLRAATFIVVLQLGIARETDRYRPGSTSRITARVIGAHLEAGERTFPAGLELELGHSDCWMYAKSLLANGALGEYTWKRDEETAISLSS